MTTPIKSTDLTDHEWDLSDKAVQACNAAVEVIGVIGYQHRVALICQIVRSLPGISLAERDRLIRYFTAR